jgi:acyl carrier protein
MVGKATPDLRSELLDLLAGLPNTERTADRRALLTYTGFDHLAGRVDFEGSSLTFFGGLVGRLLGEGLPELLTFLGRLDSWIDAPQRRQELQRVRDLIERLPAESWRQHLLPPGLDLAELVRRCQEASASEIEVMVGSKYIAQLYFPRMQVESRFIRFLDAEATCFLVVARAGRGKTNLLCHLVEQFQHERPVLFLSGRLTLQDRYSILRHVAVRLGHGEGDWLACFEELGKAAALGASPLMMIDGINESAAEPAIMQEALQELLMQAERRRIKVCVTCRTDFWQFYRAPFWGEYVWREDAVSPLGRVVRGEDLPVFAEEMFDDVQARYFEHFGVRGELSEEAYERCRNPLLLRFFCEAYSKRDVGVVTDIRLYGLFELFWERKIGQVTDLAGLGRTYPVNNLVITVARLMREQHRTSVARALVAERLGQQEDRLDEATSLYGRVLSEEILLEEEVDELLGTHNVVFVYDKFAEYAIALSIFSDQQWGSKSSAEIIADARQLMEEESQHRFATLRGSMEFLVLRMENRRTADEIHLDLLDALLDQDWKWRHIGAVLAFQLEHTDEASFWRLLWSLVRDERDFVRRISAGQLRALARQAPEQALAMLNQTLADESESVRDIALDTLHNLDPQASAREAELLVTTQPLGSRSIELAAEALLYPRDSQSTLLQEKVRWLVDGHPGSAVRAAVLDHLRGLDLPAHEDLYALEELERAFQVDWRGGRKPRNLYLDVIEQQVAQRRLALEADLERLDVLVQTVTELLDLTVRTLDMRRTQPLAVLSTTLDVLVPDPGQLRPFLDMVQRHFGVDLRRPEEPWNPRWTNLQRYLPVATAPPRLGGRSSSRRRTKTAPLPTLGWLAVQAAGAAPAFANAPLATSLLVPSQLVGYEGSAPGLNVLLEINSSVIEEGARLSGTDPQRLGARTELGRHGLELQPDVWTAFRTRMAGQFGVTVSPARQRALSSLGRVVLTIWHAHAGQASREQAVDRRAMELADHGVDAIQQRLTPFEDESLPESMRSDLTVELQALCRLYATTQPARIIQALAPLIIWHHERDSTVVNQAFASLRWLDRDAFWLVAQEMLEHEDQRIVDFASQALEQAEADEREGSGAVLDGIRGVLSSELGIDSARFRPDADFKEDLEADSLDLVEVVLALEEKFQIEISDDEIARWRTVRDAAEYIQRQLGITNPEMRQPPSVPHP